MSIVTLDDYEKEIVRHLAKQFNEGTLNAYEASWPRAKENGQRAFQIRNRFVGLGWLYWDESETGLPQSLRHRFGGGRSLKIDPTILEVVHYLDNPPPPDHWQNLTVWFRSKWWSLPVLLIAFGVPALWSWVQVLRGLLEWFGVIKSE
jgi:hypothetical protein